MDKKTSKFNKNFVIKTIVKKLMKYFLEVDVQYLEKLRELHNDLSFFARQNEN